MYFSGAGGMISTAKDYLQFAQMLVNGGQMNGKRFLSPKTVELMTSNHTGDMVNGQFGRPARGMGFGLSVQTVLDPVAADLRVGKGTFGWAGGTGVNVNIDPQEQIVTPLHGPDACRSDAARFRERRVASDCRIEGLSFVLEGLRIRTRLLDCGPRLGSAVGRRAGGGAPLVRGRIRRAESREVHLHRHDHGVDQPARVDPSRREEARRQG